MGAPLVRRELAAHHGRWALIGAAVTVAVAAASGAFGFSANVRGLIVPAAGATATLPEGTVVVTPRLDGLTTATSLDQQLVDTVRSVEGVAAASGSYDQPVSFVVRGDEGPPRPPMLRGVVFSSTTSERWDLLEGRFPDAPDEVALDEGGLAVAATSLGGRRDLQVPVGTLRVTVVGVVRAAATPTSTPTRRPPASAGRGSVALGQANVVLDPRWAPDLLDAVGRVDRITVIPAPGVSLAALAGRLRATLPRGVQVIAVDSPTAVQQAAVNGIDTGVAAATVAYAVLMALVSSLVVANAQNVLLAQRTRELGLLRTLGASARQVRRLVIGQSVVVGLIATGVGVGLGSFLARVALRVVRDDVGGGWPLTPAMAGAGAVVGLVVSVGGALVPARRAVRVAPLDALSDTRGGAERPTRWVAAGAAVVLGLASVAVVVRAPSRPAWVAALGSSGGLMALVGLAGLSRAVVAPMAAAIGKAARRPLGISGRLGLGNAQRQPSRTAGAASTLMIALALVATVGVVGASARAAIDQQVGASPGVDLFAQRRGVVRVSTEVADEILRWPRLGVDRHVSLSALDGVVLIGGASTSATVADLEDLDAVVDLDLSAGRAAGQGVLVADRIARRDGLELGDSVVVRSTSGRQASARITGIHRDSSFAGPVVVSMTLARELAADGTFEQAAIRLRDGAPERRLQRRINRSLSLLPKVGVTTPAEWAELRSTVVATSLRIIGVLLAGAIGLGLAGLAMTQALSVVERRRELELLWSVGAHRRQLRRMVSLEAVFVALLASVIGIGSGVALGWIAMAAAPDSIGGARSVPWSLLIVVAAASALAAWAVSRPVAVRSARVGSAEAAGRGRVRRRAARRSG